MPDILTPEQRSYCMSKVRSKDTSPERAVRSALHRLGYRFRKHVKDLPGKPDIVFTRRKVAVFVDGDFWHGFGFESWGGKLSPKWRSKIERNMARDQGRDLRRAWLGSFRLSQVRSANKARRISPLLSCGPVNDANRTE